MAEDRRQILAIVQGVERLTARAVTRITLDLTANLIRVTPVDTGWARANWVPRIGTPLESPVGSRDSPSAAAQASGQAAVLAYRVREGVAPRVHVTNNVPYIEALNDGHSVQQPAGFVQRAIQVAVSQDLSGLG